MCRRSLAHTNISGGRAAPTYECSSLDGSSPLRLCFIYAARYSWPVLVLLVFTGFCHHTVYGSHAHAPKRVTCIAKAVNDMSCSGFILTPRPMGRRKHLTCESEQGRAYSKSP